MGHPVALVDSPARALAVVQRRPGRGDGGRDNARGIERGPTTATTPRNAGPVLRLPALTHHLIIMPLLGDH